MNIGSVEATIKVRDEFSAALDRAARKFKEFTQQAASGGKKGGHVHGAALSPLEKAAREAERAAERLRRVQEKVWRDEQRYLAGRAAAMDKSVKAQIAASQFELRERQKNAAAGVRLAMQQAQAEQARVNAGINAMRAREAAALRSTNAINRLHAQAIVENKKFDDQLRRNTSTMGSWAGSLASGALGAVGLGASIAGTIYTLYQFTKSLIDAEVSMTQMMLRFEVTAGGNVQQAGQMFEFVRDQAARVGISLEDAGQSFSRFAANVKGTTLEGKQAQDIFIGVSEAAAAMGLSGYQVSRAFLALEQMMSKGTVQSEELRGQLSEQIPGAYQTAAKAMGVTTRELAKMLKNGDVLATDLLPKLAAEWHKTFGPAAEKNAQRLTGALAALESSWFRFKTAILDSGAATGFFAGLANAIGQSADHMERLNTAKDKFIHDFEVTHGVTLNPNERKRVLAAQSYQGSGQNTSQDEIERRRAEMLASVVEESQARVRAELGKTAKELFLVQAALGGESMQAAVAAFESNMDKAERSAENLAEKLKTNFTIQSNGSVAILAQQFERAKAPVEELEDSLEYIVPDIGAAEKAAEQLAERIADFEQGLADSAAVHAEFNRVLTESGGDYELASMSAQAFSEVLRLSLDPTKGEGAELVKLSISAQQAAKKIEDARRALEQFIDTANDDAQLMEDWEKDLKAARDRVVDLTFELEHEVAASRDYVVAVQSGSAAVREFNIQQEVMRRLKAEEDLQLKLTTEEWNAYARNVDKAVREMDAYNKIAEIAAERMQILSDLATGLFTGIVDNFVDTFADVLKTGEFTWKKLGESLRDTFIDVFADILKQWLLLQAQMAAGDYLAGRGQSGSGGGWWAQILRQFSGGKSSGGGEMSYLTALYKYGAKQGWWGGGAMGAGNAGAIAYGTSYGTAAAGSTYGVTTGGAINLAGPTTTTSTSAAAANAATGSSMSTLAAFNIWAVAIMAMLAVASKHAADRAKKLIYGTASGAEFDPTTGTIKAGWSGKLDKTGPLIAGKIVDLLNSLVSASGTFITGMNTAIVRIRNDKKRFDAYVGEMYVGSFKTAEEAIFEAARKAFTSATFATALDPVFKSLIATFEVRNADNLLQAAEIAKGILDAASGLSDLGLQIQNIIPSIRQMAQSLINLGTNVGVANQLAAQFAANSFMSLRRQITGEQESPQEQLKRRQAEAKLFNAQLALYRLEIKARADYLRAQISAAKAELGIEQTEAKGRVARLKILGGLVRSEAKLARFEIDASAAKLRAEVKLWEAELKLLDEIDAVLATLNIDIGKIRVGGFGGLSRAMGELKDALLDLAKFQKDMLTGPNSPFTEEQQTKILRGELFGLLNKDKLKADDVRRIMELIPDYLEAFGNTFGTSGPGYFAEFSKIQELIESILKANGIKPGVDWRKQLKDLFGDTASMGPNGSLKAPYTILSPVLEREARQTTTNTADTKRAVEVGTSNIVEAVKSLTREVSALRTAGGTGSVLYSNRMPGTAAA